MLLCCRRGGPGLEFGLCCPVLILMVMGVYDIGEALITMRRVTLAAQEVVEAATAFAATTGALGITTSAQAVQAMSIAQAVLPQLLGSSAPSYGIGISSVAIVASPANCTSNCTYTAHTAWSANINGGQSALRSCGALLAVPNTQSTSLTTLPSGVFYPPAAFVADVSLLYTPTFSMFFTKPFQMTWSAYMPPRGLGAAQYVQLSVNGSYSGYKCSGYP